MNTIEQVLAKVPRPDGFLSAHLVDAGTGQVLADLTAGTGPGAAPPPGQAPAGPGDPTDDVDDVDDVLAAGHALAGVVTQALQDLGGVLTLHGLADDPEDLVLTMSDHLHLVRLLPDLGGTDAFLLVTLDRARTNLALARYLVRRMEAELVP